MIKYLKNRDMIKKSIKQIEQNKEGFDIKVKFEDKGEFFIVQPNIDDVDNIITDKAKKINLGLVILNTTRNFKKIFESWDKLVKLEYLTLYFINPFSDLEKKWIIKPYIHDKICDKASLKTGLKSMFETVEVLNEDAVKTKFEAN